MWGRFRVGVLIVMGTGLAQTSMSLAGPAGPGAGTSAAPGAPALRALDKPAFTATPAELLALGKAAPTGDGSMVVLRDQRDVSYDDQGRATVRTRRVYVVQVALRIGDDHDNAGRAMWHPSYQDRPVIRARTISPAGTVVELDPAQVTEEPAGSRAAGAASDVRYVLAPLPAPEQGSVVEQEVVTTDRVPLPGGSMETLMVGPSFPTSSIVISYSAPASVRLHHVERQLPASARVRHQVAGGRETWSYEFAALSPRFDREVDLPEDVVAAPYVGVSTAASWEAVARAYRKLLDQRIAEGPIELPAELPHAASAEAVDAITAWVHHHVHRQGDGLYEELRVPRPPAETVQQAAGDGNDKATLLVALLRQAGIRADVALVATAWGARVDPDLPGVNAFDRAIVRARVGARDLWIDPVEDLARPGQLPEQDQGRRALVIADDTRALAVTPQAASTDNRIRDVRTFVAAEQGWSKLTRVVRSTGVFEIEHRNQARGRPDLLKRMFAARSERLFGGTLDQLTSSGPEDLTTPFEMTFEVKDAHRVTTALSEIHVYLYPHATFEELPFDGQTVHIKIDRTAFALLDAGKPRDALAEGQRLIALHPAEALHHTQLALVLLRAGAGEAARREARKAVAMAPRDVDALVGLGWILSFDTVGRAYTYDWDRAGAIAALRQAHKLDPKHLGAMLTLADALQHGPSGRIYDGADLAGAAEVWRDVLAIDKTDEHAVALARVLVWSEQFAEAEKVARGAGASEDRDRWIVTAVAGRGGGAAAIQVAGELRSGDARNRLLSFAGWTMTMLQRYDVAHELLSSSGMLPRASTGPTAMLAALQRHPPLQLRPADPRSVMLELLRVQLDPLRKPPVFWDAMVERELRGGVARSMAGAVRGGIGGRWLDDVVQSMHLEVEGGAGVWRATVDGDGKPQSFYLALDRGAVKVIGGGYSVTGVGRYVLRLDARDDARARRMLDWLRADLDRPNAPEAYFFKQLWGQGIPTSHDAIQLAAALLADWTDPDRVLPVATRCASTLPDAEVACHMSKFVAYRARKQWAEAVAESEAILAARPSWSDGRVQYHAWVLARAGRFDDADRMLAAVLARTPDHRGAMFSRFEVAAIRASSGAASATASAELVQRGEELVNAPAAGPGELNGVAWQRLAMAGTPGPAGDLTRALELARKAVDKAPQSGGILNTLAALEAEHGDLDRAIPDNTKAMELRHIIEPTSDDWFVIGRILEQLGLAGDATAAYKRVTPPLYDQLVNTYLLAQRRLAAIARP
jgi:tetratricopeptide (TPR) repeat protein/transglutaminase-like putative cysteine protease